MPSNSDLRDCPRCKHQIQIKVSGRPWPLLVCNQCLKKETRRTKQEDRIQRRQKAGTPLTLGMLEFQAEPAPMKLEKPTLRAEDLPADVRSWLTKANVSVEMLEAVSAPYGHALVARNSPDALNNDKDSSAPTAYIKREKSADSEDTKLSSLAHGRDGNKTLFVGGLHREAKKTTLSWFFKDFTHDIKFVRHNWKVKGRGRAVDWALIELDTPSEAARAVRELDGEELLECKVTLQLHTLRTSVQSFEAKAYEEAGRTLYIRGLEPDVTEDMLLTFMDDFEARVHVIKNDYAIVEVSSNTEALRAIDWLDGQRVLKRKIQLQLKWDKMHESVPLMHFKAPRALSPVYKLESDHEQKPFSAFSRNEIKQEEPRQSEYYVPQTSFDGGIALPVEYPPLRRLDNDLKHQGSVIKADMDSMSQLSDVPSTGESPHNIEEEVGGGDDWVSRVLNEILQMEMTSRPSSWLDVSLSVQRELQHQLMIDITEGDPSEGTPISVPLLELLDYRVQALREP